MSTMVLRIEGDRELIAKLNRYGISILDLSDSMRRSGAFLSEFFANEVFASRGGVIGKPWQPLNDNYAAFKAERFPGRPPLIKSGDMNRGFKFRSGKLSAEMYNTVEYFDYHNEGRGVPERVMMAVDQTRERRVVDFVADDLANKQRQVNV